MGFISNVVKRLLWFFIYTTFILIIVAIIPNIPPYSNFSIITLEPPQARKGPLALNTDLNNADKVFVNKLLGPEAFQIYNGELYTGLSTGEIVKISPGGHVTFVTKFGQPCSGIIQEHICGRPLGFEIDEKNHLLYVADAYYGIWKVNLKDDTKTLLVSPRVAIKGRKPKLFNAVARGKNGDLYWTDSSSEFGLSDGALGLLTDPTGRLFHYNAATNKSSVLLDNIWFPNGLVVSPNKDFIILAETAHFRLLKYYIEGPNRGKTEVFIAGLPGTPDNVRVLPDGSGMLVGLFVTYDDDNPLLSRAMTETPVVRMLLARVQILLQWPFKYLNSLLPNVVFEDIIYNIGHFKSLSTLIPRQSGLIYIDWKGTVISSHYNTDGSLGHISDAIYFNDRLYTGSPHIQNYIGSVPVPRALRKAFKGLPSQKHKEVKKEAPKPVDAPKPTPKPVQTPKPTPKPVEAPKPTPKPVEAPKPTPKPVEAPKPTPKPVEARKPTPKPVEAPKPTPKPAEAIKPDPQAQKPKTEAKREAKTPPQTPKPQAKTTPPPKPEAQAKTTPPPPTKPITKTTPEVKSTTPKPEVKSEKKVEKPVKEEKKPDQIPITEEIPSDTAKPAKETLKVIKKGGPAEIPNPHL